VRHIKDAAQSHGVSDETGLSGGAGPHGGLAGLAGETGPAPRPARRAPRKWVHNGYASLTRR